MTYIQYKNSLNGGSGLNYVNCIIQVTIHIHSHKWHFGTVHGQSSDECIYMFNSFCGLFARFPQYGSLRSC